MYYIGRSTKVVVVRLPFSRLIWSTSSAFFVLPRKKMVVTILHNFGESSIKPGHKSTLIFDLFVTILF